MNNLKHKSETWLLAAFVALALSAMPTFTHAQTLVCGNISGTWAPAGNPYIVTCDATVPSGQTLTIQPGVIVMIWSNVTVTANGLIQAVGTPTERISFQAAVPSQYWNQIRLMDELNQSPGTNRFKYCDFRNGNTALWMRVFSGNATMNIEIINCNFSNCVSGAIYGEAQGNVACWGYGGGSKFAIIAPIIRNCGFYNTGNGCQLKIYGAYCSADGGPYIGYGYANPRIIGNIFEGLNGPAFLMSVGSYAGSGSPIFINNTIINCRVGIDATDPWDARVQDNIFVGATNAVKVSGSLTRTVSYNDFYGNATNFTGCPACYGTPIWPNRNGTMSDCVFDIFENPLFVATNDFHLATNSACIDAGTPDWAFTDMCFKPQGPGQGSAYPDLGAYGGPDACNWLDEVPIMPVIAFMSKTNDQVWLNWGAIPRSEYQVQCVTNLVSVGTNDWLDFDNGHVLAADKPTSMIIATDKSKMFFRVQSLGRPDGN